MARQQYPLEVLRRLRDERAEAQAHSLAEQVARCSLARAAVDERQRVRREQAQRTRETLQAERERLAAGKLCGADLLRSAEFEAAAAVQAELLERAEADARLQLAQEQAEERKLRDELSRREAEAELTRNHAANFHEQNESAALRAEEEAALEQWNARHR
jgi:hypothetical protein